MSPQDNQKVWYLKQIDLFEGIPDEEIMQIAQKVVEKKCNKKELLYTPFESTDSICVLKKGEVTLYHSHYGKKLIIDVLKPGSIFGAIPFQNEASSDHFAEVTEEAYICFFTPEDFLKIVEAKPKLMLRVLKMMSEKLAEYEDRMKTGLYDAKEKILHHLEQIEAKSQGIFGKFTSKNLTHEKLSQLTGLSRETVTRAITALKKEGRIENNEDGKLQISN